MQSPVIVINRFAIKPGKLDEFADAQRRYASTLARDGFVGGRLYRGLDGASAVLVSMFASRAAQEAIAERADFKEHIAHLRPLIESSTPSLYEEAYTTGDFK